MNTQMQRHSCLSLQYGHVVGRRDFLRQVSAASLAAGSLNLTDMLSASAVQMRSRGMACIMLWMQGGPSQFETFSPKPDHANGGDTKAIQTSVPGIHIADNFPHCANIMDDMAIIRSMTSKEGNHQRATYLMHHGYLPMGGVKFPTLGSNVAHQIGTANSQLPSCVRIGGRLPNSGGGGFLGVEYDPLILPVATRPPQNTTPQTDVSRYERRLRLLDGLQEDFADGSGAQVVADHRQLAKRASDMILSPSMEAFALSNEPSGLRDTYGTGDFAAGCMLARRLVEHGVTFVEVTSRGWDTHRDGFSRTQALSQQIDQPMAALISDLKQRGLLESTLVVWMGEFGRTPRINPSAGRDHYPKAFNAVVAGGGLQGGQVVGQTDPGGTTVVDRPVSVQDLFRTIYHTLQIDAEHENVSHIGRPIKLVDGGEVVEELIG
ncbi:MAG: DUF1501 domain-containing protein [Pirellulales bacterium]|nr:DUF1501 domain-containing protein [Pirellulales bacterium]